MRGASSPCRLLIHWRSAEESFVNVSSAAELQLYLEFAAYALKRSVSRSRDRRKSPSIIASADGPAPASPPPCSGHRQPRQGRLDCLPATTCQRSARASCYAVRSQFWPRARDTLSARLECQPSRLHLGYQIHQTYCFFDIFRAAPTAVGRLLCALGSKL